MIKRRDLLLASALGAFLPRQGKSAAPPCPPPEFNIAGGGGGSLSCGLSTAPAWYQGMPTRTWATPLNNSAAVAANRHWLGASGVKDPLADTTNRLTSGLVNATYGGWNGFGCDSQRKMIFMLASGGHNDYGGNEVYSCDLSQATPMWTRRRDAYPVSDGVYVRADGSPTSSHNYASHVSGLGRWFLSGLYAGNLQGNSRLHNWMEFNPDTNSWINRDQTGVEFANGSSSLYSGAAFDPIDNQLIKCIAGDNNNGSLRYYNIADGAFASVLSRGTADFPGPYTTRAWVDTTNHMLLVWNSHGTGFKWTNLFSNATKVAVPATIVPTGTPPQHMSVNGNYGSPYFWHPAYGAFVFWDTASSVKLLTPTVTGTGATRAYTSLTWSSLALGTGGVTPPSAVGGNGIGGVGRVGYLANVWGGGESLLVIGPNHSFPDLWVFKL